MSTQFLHTSLGSPQNGRRTAYNGFCISTNIFSSSIIFAAENICADTKTIRSGTSSILRRAQTCVIKGKIYKRKTDRQRWSKEAMTATRKEVEMGASTNTASQKDHLSEATLQHYARKYSEENLPISARRFRFTFTDEQLENLYIDILMIP
ncbi:hypothetical protein ABEB36_004528 [Hypothenemus hampei]|uniref:Uncharacterized protein n=1 Tax=Hypothenemus hampei TaxID=57062 RepID=A0ABD1F3M7_HYPHA